jgi:hypothetical protein
MTGGSSACFTRASAWTHTLLLLSPIMWTITTCSAASFATKSIPWQRPRGYYRLHVGGVHSIRGVVEENCKRVDLNTTPVAGKWSC